MLSQATASSQNEEEILDLPEHLTTLWQRQHARMNGLESELGIAEYVTYVCQQTYEDHFISEPFVTLIITRLNAQSLNALQSTCKSISSVLKDLVPTLSLWERILDNCPRNTVALSKQYPDAMLRVVPRLDGNEKYIRITPIQLTLQLFDVTILDHFLQQIKSNMDLIREFIKQSQPFLSKFNYVFDMKLPDSVSTGRGREEKRINLMLDAQENLRICQRDKAISVATPQFEVSTWGSFSATCKTRQTFFKKPLEEAKLLYFVKIADWQKINNLIKLDPDQMFKKYKYRIDGELVNISAVQYACMLYDSCCRKLFLNTIGDDKDAIQLFMEQESEQKRHLDLQPLFLAYQHYQAQRILFIDNKITREEMLESERTLSNMQHALLPCHIMRILANPCLAWSYEMQFNVDDINEMIRYPFFVKKYVDHNDFINSWERVIYLMSLGFVLQRGSADTAILSSNRFYTVGLDSILIQCLWASRINEYNNAVEELNQSVHKKVFSP